MTPRVETHIRLGICAVSQSDQSPRCPHKETLGPYLPIAKFRWVSQQNLPEFLRELSKSFAEKSLGEMWFLFSSTKKKEKKKEIRTKGVPQLKKSMVVRGKP